MERGFRMGYNFEFKIGVGGFGIRLSEVGLDSEFVSERQTQWCFVVV